MTVEDKKTMLTIKVDRKAMDCLDRIAVTGNEKTTQLMVRFFDSIQYSVQLLVEAQGVDPNTIRDELAKLLLMQAPQASPEAFRFAASIWDRAAELSAQEGEDKC